MRVLDQHLALHDSPDLPCVVAEQEDLPPHALNREVLLDLTDKGVLRLGDNVVGGVVRNRPSVGEGRDSRSPPRLEPSVDHVTMQVRPAAALTRSRPIGEHLHRLGVPLSWQVTVRVGPTDEVEEFVFAAVLGGALGDDLLGQNVQRPVGYGQRVEDAVT